MHRITNTCTYKYKEFNVNCVWHIKKSLFPQICNRSGIVASLRITDKRIYDGNSESDFGVLFRNSFQLHVQWIPLLCVGYLYNWSTKTSAANLVSIVLTLRPNGGWKELFQNEFWMWPKRLYVVVMNLKLHLFEFF